MEGISCTSPDCPCLTVADLGPAIGSLINDQKGTDSIVYPLVAGTLAHCVLASARREPRTLTGLPLIGLAEHARLVMRLADAADDEAVWGRDRKAFTTIVLFVMGGWEILLEWVPDHYLPIVANWTEPTTASLLKAARAWVDRGEERSLTELVLFSGDVANRLVTKKLDLPLMTKPMRPVRVELAARLRAMDLTTWPRVLRAAVQDWNTESLERLLLDYASDAGGLAFDFETMLREEIAGLREETAGDRESEAIDAIEPIRREREDRPDPDAEALLTDAMAEIDRAEARTRAVEAKRLELADRYAGLQGRVDRLTKELALAEHEINGLRSELEAVRRERDDLADRAVAEDALANDESLPPSDAFAGQCVYLFTGHTSGEVREEMAVRFADFGPSDVVVYDADVNRGPDAYPANAVVILDVSFMSHSASDYVLSRARSSQVWCFRGSYGPSRLAKAAAAAFTARRSAGQVANGAVAR